MPRGLRSVDTSLVVSSVRFPNTRLVGDLNPLAVQMAVIVSGKASHIDANRVRPWGLALVRPTRGQLRRLVVKWRLALGLAKNHRSGLHPGSWGRLQNGRTAPAFDERMGREHVPPAGGRGEAAKRPVQRGVIRRGARFLV